ncbi:MAG TPA: acylphosphatase [Gemmatimonadaceae bacterium]
MSHLHVVVRGRVQGVGFRWFVRERARALDLAGWVMNRGDGCVEVAADGAEHAIAQLRAVLGRGPDGANVTAVEDLESNDGSLDRPFTIAR